MSIHFKSVSLSHKCSQGTVECPHFYIKGGGERYLKWKTYFGNGRATWYKAKFILRRSGEATLKRRSNVAPNFFLNLFQLAVPFPKLVSMQQVFVEKNPNFFRISKTKKANTDPLEQLDY